MSTEKIHTPTDPEKGLEENVFAPELPKQAMVSEKVKALAVEGKEIAIAKAASAAPKKAKKKVSKWILWTLWFNTYR
jgi:hypothetical protein